MLPTLSPVGRGPEDQANGNEGSNSDSLSGAWESALYVIWLCYSWRAEYTCEQPGLVCKVSVLTPKYQVSR